MTVRSIQLKLGKVLINFTNIRNGQLLIAFRRNDHTAASDQEHWVETTMLWSTDPPWRIFLVEWAMAR